jgi:hypothetical protein
MIHFLEFNSSLFDKVHFEPLWETEVLYNPPPFTHIATKIGFFVHIEGLRGDVLSLARGPFKVSHF